MRPLSRCTERALACSKAFSLLPRGHHPRASAASPRSLGSHRVGAMRRRPRSLRPTSATHKILLSTLVDNPRRVPESGLAPSRTDAHATQERGVHARARFGVPSRAARAISCARAAIRRPSGVLACSRARACVTSTRPGWRERPSIGSLRRVNGRNDAVLLRTPSTLLRLSRWPTSQPSESRALGRAGRRASDEGSFCSMSADPRALFRALPILTVLR